MQIWVVVKGQYEDAHTVAVATSEESANRLMESVPNEFNDHMCVDGPYETDQLDCGHSDVPYLCPLHD